MVLPLEATDVPGVYRRGSRFVAGYRAGGRQHKESAATLAGERLAATLPRAERHHFPAAGHLPDVTHPGEYLDAVTDFASRTARHHTTAVP